MRTLNFVFARQPALASAVIRGFGVLGEWSHCGIVDGDVTDYLVKNPGMRHVWSELPVIESLALQGGVVINSLGDVVDRSSAFEIVNLQCPRPDLGREWARSIVGAKYDWAGIAAFMFRERDWQDPAKQYCSEKCAAAADRSGIQLVNKRMQGIHPSTLYHLIFAANAAQAIEVAQ